MMNQVYIYYLLFMIYAIIGWLSEGIFRLITNRSFINSGFLIGPYLPIYGWEFLLITILFSKYFNDSFVLFVLIILLWGILEYSTNYIMEKIFKVKWWNCKKYKLNINERICLERIIPVGLILLLIMKYINPFFLRMFLRLNSKLVMALAIILFIVFIVDCLLSEKIVGELSKKVYEDKLNDKDLSYLEQRLLKAYPRLVVSKCK